MRGFILHLGLPSRQNTQRAGHVRVLLVCHLPFLIDVCRKAVCVLFFNLLPLSFNLLPLSFANLDLALRRIATFQLLNFDSSFNEFNLQPLYVG